MPLSVLAQKRIKLETRNYSVINKLLFKTNTAEKFANITPNTLLVIPAKL